MDLEGDRQGLSRPPLNFSCTYIYIFKLISMKLNKINFLCCYYNND